MNRHAADTVANQPIPLTSQKEGSHTMASQKPAFLLFPITTLSRSDTQKLVFLLPRLQVLQAVHPPVFQPWTADRFTAWPVIADETMKEEIRGRWREFQEYAAIHGEKGLLESAARRWFAGEDPENRFSIQETLRGEGTGRDDAPTPKSLLVEGALFLEMARDLDEKAGELEEGLARANTLEEEFRDILGLSEGDELDEVPDALNLPLFNEIEDVAYRLPQRMASWLRLIGAVANLPEAPILISSHKKILEELAEAARELRRDPEGEANLPLPLWAFSDLGKLSSEDFSALLEDSRVSSAAAQWWEALDSVMDAGENDTFMETCWMKGAALQQAFEDAAEGKFDLPDEKVGLSITVLRECSLDALWKAFDKAAGHFPPQERLLPASTPVLNLTVLS